MSSFLEGPLKKAIAAGFRGKLTRGKIRQPFSIAVDSFGDTQGVKLREYSFEGTRDNFSAFYHAQAGIPLTDVSILVILGSTTVTPKQDDEVFIKGMWHKVRRVLEIDPAGATAKLQAYEIANPDAP